MHQNLLTITAPVDVREKASPSFAEDWCITSSGKQIDYRQYQQDLAFLTGLLPDDARFAFNLCHDRYTFLVALHAIALKGQTSLLPPNQAPGTQRALYQQFRDSYLVTDASLASDLPIPTVRLQLPGRYSPPSHRVPIMRSTQIIWRSCCSPPGARANPPPFVSVGGSCRQVSHSPPIALA